MASSKTINVANKYDRVVVLVDMDCFYCQVEEKLNSSLAGKPIAVVQYNAWRGGGIIAVNYPARAQGVTRHMRGDEAREQCPDIELVRVPSVREKADLTKYRVAGKEVAAVLQSFTSLLERASIDEAYLDITEQVATKMSTMDKGEFQLKPSQLVNTYAVGYDSIGDYIQEISSRIGCDEETDEFDCDETEVSAVRQSDLKLLIGASIVSEIRAKVKEITGYECSAGIAHNKILAKLSCGINKPNKQTILPLRQIKHLFRTLPVGKVKGLGGKFGEDLCERLKIKFLGDLLPFTEVELQKTFDEKTGTWLHLISRGIDLEAVTPRFYSKSIGCCKKFPGRNAINGLNTLIHWFSELANEICDRLEVDVTENNRRAKQMVVSYIQEISGEDISSSRSTSLQNYDPEAMAKLALETLKKNTEQFFKPNSDNVLNNPLKFLGISVGKFETIETNKNTLEKMFQNQAKKKLEETNSVEVSQNLASSTTSTVSEPPKEKENPIKKSFFAAHLKKSKNSAPEFQTAAETLAINKEQENQKPIDNKKSFFANALKRKSDTLLGLTKTNANAVVEDDTISSSMTNMTVSDKTNEAGPSRQTSEANLRSVYSEPGPSRQPDNAEYNTDFTKEYAEYLIPDPTPEDYIKCEKCGKSILHYTMDTHMDYHFAFELSQEQRQQFRNEFKAKMMSPPAKKPRPSSNSNKSKTTTVPQIDKFFVKSSVNNSNEVDENDKQKCIECGCLILVSKIVEHMDYHAARKLQREMNSSQINSSLTQSSVKKINSSKNTKAGPNKSIKAFFISQS